MYILPIIDRNGHKTHGAGEQQGGVNVKSPSEVRLGYKVNGTVNAYHGPSNISLVGAARSGKATTVTIPICLTYAGSMIISDPKGQHLCRAAAHRLWNMGHDLYSVNPFQKHLPLIEGIPDVGYNPMEPLNPEDLTFIEDCDQMAGGIVIGGRSTDDNAAYFSESARGLCGGMIAAVKVLYPLAPEMQNLVTVHDIIASPETFFSFAKRCVDTRDDLLVSRFGRFDSPSARDSKEVDAILATLRTNCRFIGGRAMRKSLSAPPAFRWRDLKKRPTTVHLTLPLVYGESLERWTRVVFTGALKELSEPEENSIPVLGIFDEFKSTLARLDLIEDAMSYSAGVGFQIMPIWQDLNQAVEAFPHSWQTMFGNSGVQVFFRPRENFTANYISELLGDTEVIARTKNLNYPADTNWNKPDQIKVQVAENRQQLARKLMAAQEVRQLADDKMIIFAENLPHPVIAFRKPFYDTREFDGQYGPDPHRPWEKVKGPVPKGSTAKTFSFGK